MSKIQWEYNLVERPFCEQLQTMGWSWIEGDLDVAELTERESFREVFLKGRLAEALRRINLRDGQPWLDEARITKSIRDLSPATVHRVMEVNQAAPVHLLYLIRNFTVFQQVDGKTRKVVARYQQFRAIQNATLRLQEERTRSQGADRDERGGIIWHTQGSGKSLSMVFLVR